MQFIPIEMRIVWMDGERTSRVVNGYAFETPGWPEFHAVVWFGSRYFLDSPNGGWNVAHFESGLNVDCALICEKHQAPLAVAVYLQSKGRRKVRKTIRQYL